MCLGAASGGTWLWGQRPDPALDSTSDPQGVQADHDCLRLNFSTYEVGIRPALPPLCESDAVMSGLVTQALLWGPMKAELAPFGPHTQGQSGWLRVGPRFALESTPPRHLPVSATCSLPGTDVCKGLSPQRQRDLQV